MSVNYDVSESEAPSQNEPQTCGDHHQCLPESALWTSLGFEPPSCSAVDCCTHTLGKRGWRHRGQGSCPSRIRSCPAMSSAPSLDPHVPLHIHKENPNICVYSIWFCSLIAQPVQYTSWRTLSKRFNFQTVYFISQVQTSLLSKATKTSAVWFNTSVPLHILWMYMCSCHMLSWNSRFGRNKFKARACFCGLLSTCC